MYTQLNLDYHQKDKMIVDTTPNVALTTKKLNTKIEYLSRDKQQAEEYITDLEYVLRLNKCVLQQLSANTGDSSIGQVLECLEKENGLLRKRLDMEIRTKQRIELECIKKQTERTTLKKFYRKRIEELAERIEEVRLRMHQKEFSFTKILERVTQYEQVKEKSLKDKLIGLEFTYEQRFTNDLIGRLSRQKACLKKQLERSKNELKMCIKETQKIQCALSNQVNFSRLKDSEGQGDLVFKPQQPISREGEQQDGCSIQAQSKKLQSQYNSSIQLNKTIIQLIRKQKLANGILQSQFKQSVESNEEVINWNRVLYASNQKVCNSIKKQEAKIMVLEDQLREYQAYFHHQKRERSEGGEEVYKYQNIVDNDPSKLYLESLAEDVDKLGVHTAVEDCVIQARGPKVKRAKRSLSLNSFYCIGNVLRQSNQQFMCV